MTRFNTVEEHDATTGKRFIITFETDNETQYKHMQEEARKCIDGIIGAPPIRTKKLCDTCAYNLKNGSICSKRDDCLGCKVSYRDGLAVRCRCCQINTGDPCPYYTEDEKC